MTSFSVNLTKTDLKSLPTVNTRIYYKEIKMKLFWHFANLTTIFEDSYLRNIFNLKLFDPE